jgi:hypothetical protein
LIIEGIGIQSLMDVFDGVIEVLNFGAFHQ